MSIVDAVIYRMLEKIAAGEKGNRANPMDDGESHVSKGNKMHAAEHGRASRGTPSQEELDSAAISKNQQQLAADEEKWYGRPTHEQMVAAQQMKEHPEMRPMYASGGAAHGMPAGKHGPLMGLEDGMSPITAQNNMTVATNAPAYQGHPTQGILEQALIAEQAAKREAETAAWHARPTYEQQVAAAQEAAYHPSASPTAIADSGSAQGKALLDLLARNSPGGMVPGAGPTLENAAYIGSGADTVPAIAEKILTNSAPAETAAQAGIAAGEHAIPQVAENVAPTVAQTLEHASPAIQEAFHADPSAIGALLAGVLGLGGIKVYKDQAANSQRAATSAARELARTRATADGLRNALAATRKSGLSRILG